jgi:hypothetical protein
MSCFGTPATWMTLNGAVAELFRTPATWTTLNPQQLSSFSIIYVGQICYVALINEKGFHQPAGWLQKVTAVNGMLTHIRTLIYSEDKSQVTANWLTNMATKIRPSDLFDDTIFEMFVASHPTSVYAHYIQYSVWHTMKGRQERSRKPVRLLYFRTLEVIRLHFVYGNTNSLRWPVA